MYIYLDSGEHKAVKLSGKYVRSRFLSCAFRDRQYWPSAIGVYEKYEKFHHGANIDFYCSGNFLKRLGVPKNELVHRNEPLLTSTPAL